MKKLLLISTVLLGIGILYATQSGFEQKLQAPVEAATPSSPIPQVEVVKKKKVTSSEVLKKETPKAEGKLKPKATFFKVKPLVDTSVDLKSMKDAPVQPSFEVEIFKLEF